MSHWRSGWKFWPDPPKGPTGADYRQLSWVRPYRPGFPRVATATVLAVVVAYVAVVGVLILLSSPAPVAERVLVAFVVIPAAGGLGVLVGRTFASGVYVNDAGLRLVTLRRTLTAPWSEVVDVSDVERSVGVLGWPVPRLPGRVVVVTLRDLGPISTQLTSWGADFLGRPEAYAMAAGAVERWWRDAGRR